MSDLPARRPGKPRRIDFSPDEFIAGVAGLDIEVVGAYWLICSAIYSRGEPIDDDERWIARMLRLDVRRWRRIRATLIERGKLQIIGGKVANRRCEIELAKARGRIDTARENGARGGRPPGAIAETSAGLRAEIEGTSAGDRPEIGRTSARSSADPPTIPQSDLSKINDIAKPGGSLGGKANYQLPTTSHQLPESGRGSETAPAPEHESVQYDRDACAEVACAWNEMATPIGLPTVLKLTSARRRLVTARLREVGGSVEQMRTVIARVGMSAVLRGERNSPDHQGWRADFDFIMSERGFTRLLEGKYHDRERDAPAGGASNGQAKTDGPPPGFKPYIDPRAIAEYGNGIEGAGAGPGDLEPERLVPKR